MKQQTPYRILVIDDNPAIHEDFRKILQADSAVAAETDKARAALFGLAAEELSRPIFEVEAAAQGQEGLARVQAANSEGRPFAVAFVDVRMPPGWDGVETTLNLWKADPALQVVLCTAFSDYSFDEIDRRLGRTDRLLILKKPFDNIEVRQTASSLAEKWRLNRELQAHVLNLEALVRVRTAELENSLALIQATLDSTDDGVLAVDNRGHATHFNERLLRLWNLPLDRLDNCDGEQMLAPLLRQLQRPDDFLAKIRSTIERAEAADAGEVEFKDGRVFEYASLPRIVAGKPVGRVWSFRDITQRRTAEESLRASEKHYRLLFDSNPAPIAVFDHSTRVFLAVNAAAVRIYGYSRDEFLNLTLADIALPAELETFLNRIVAGGDKPVSAGIWRHRRKDGSVLEMEITAHLVDYAGKKAWLCLATDVTQRLNLEAQLRHSQKMESVGQLAGGIAHDFNNLLTVISGHTGLLLAGDDLAAQHTERLKEVSEAARRAAELTRQLLTFSRKQELQPQVVDLDDVVKNITKMMRRIVGEDIALEVNGCPGLPAVKADLGMLEQVLLNLAVNSRDAMPRGGKLTIGTSTLMIDEAEARQNPEAFPGRYVRLSFADTGCGIPPENLARIFEPFFTTKELDRGTGLGLATVYGIIKQHQGWITVSSVVNSGTTFQIFLPATNEKSGAVASGGADQRIIGGTETILAVEDEPPLLELIQRILESYGYKVLKARNGRKALELWEQNRQKIELLLTDLILPDGMAGRELAETLQASKPGLKVVYMSGYNPETMRKEVAPGRGVQFIQKPFHARKLAETVFDCLNQK